MASFYHAPFHVSKNSLLIMIGLLNEGAAPHPVGSDPVNSQAGSNVVKFIDV
jgi:hypothetical protein